MLLRPYIPLRPRHIFKRDYAAQFERWVGYRLHPHARRALEQHWRSILPAIDLGPQSLLILCGTYRPRTRVNHFARLVRQARLPILDLQATEEETAAPQQQTVTIRPAPPDYISLGPPPLLPIFAPPPRAIPS